jgi:two-component system response regulator ResD
VVKPFSQRELVMRVKAWLRRTAGLGTNPKLAEGALNFTDLVIQEDYRKVVVANQEVILTPLEFDLLLFLAKQQGRVFNREQLLQNIWGYDYFGDLRTVDTHIKRMRAKLKIQDHFGWDIKTVWGTGYRFEVKIA